MTTKKRLITEPPKTVLIKPKEIFKKELLERIVLGDELSNRVIDDLIKLEVLNKDFANWDDYNEESIKQAFSNKNSEYFTEYFNVNQMIGFDNYMRRINTDDPNYKLTNRKAKD